MAELGLTMSTNAITNTSSAFGAYAPGAERIPVQKLGQDDFIKILVTQLTSQDPMNPQKDTEFIGQMAQFSSLQEMESLRTQQQILQANSLIGRTVVVRGEEDVEQTGTVTAVQMVKGKPEIVINNQNYPLDGVQRVWQQEINP